MPCGNSSTSALNLKHYMFSSFDAVTIKAAEVLMPRDIVSPVCRPCISSVDIQRVLFFRSGSIRVDFLSRTTPITSKYEVIGIVRRLRRFGRGGGGVEKYPLPLARDVRESLHKANSPRFPPPVSTLFLPS